MRSRIANITLRALGAVLSLIIGLYPVLYLINDRHYKLLATKDKALLANLSWAAGFYTHIICAGIALLLGWLQFNNRLRMRRPAIHRNIGKVYIIAAAAGGGAGACISFKATGGIIPAAGFFCLGIIWLYTTLRGLQLIRQGNIQRHTQLMVYSYACCFGAVTLRLWLPGLRVWMSFYDAYPIVAWLSWVPNLLVAWFINRKPQYTVPASETVA